MEREREPEQQAVRDQAGGEVVQDKPLQSTQAEAEASGLPEGKTVTRDSLPLLDAPEDYGRTDGIHTVFRTPS